MEIVARPSLGMGERNSEAATRDPGDYLSALLGTAAVAQEAAAEHDGSEIRFERQGSAERFHRNHRLDRPAGGAAVTLGEGQPQQPELGVLRPQLAAPAFRVLAVGLALLEPVAVAEQPVEALLEKPLFLAEIEIHLPSLPAPFVHHRAWPVVHGSVDGRNKSGHERTSKRSLVMAARRGGSQSQDRLGDDVLLDLVGAAVDRGLAPVEISRRDRPGPFRADRWLVPT